MAYVLRKFHQRSIDLYQKAFGKILNDQTLMVRKTEVGVVVIKTILTSSNVYSIIDQVLIVDKKIYRNNEVVYDGGKNG